MIGENTHCTWNPRKAFGSSPLIFPVILTGLPGFVCSKVTVPDTEESPLNTTIAYNQCQKTIFVVD